MTHDTLARTARKRQKRRMKKKKRGSGVCSGERRFVFFAVPISSSLVSQGRSCSPLLVGFVIQAFSEIYEAEDEIAAEVEKLAGVVRNASEAFPEVKSNIQGCADGLGWFTS